MRLRRSAFLLAILLQSCLFLTNCRYHKSKITGSDERHKNNEETRGLVVCAGEGDSFLEMISMIEQTRYRLESVLPIVVAHCNELSDESISIILSVSDVQVLNICTTANPVIASMSRRMSGFFCKPAALILSPFRHTIVADTDDVFFKKPELLFDSPQYLATGTLFFRDRWTQTRAKNSLTQGEGTAKFVFKYLEYGENFLKEWSKNSPAHREFPNYREERILNKMNLALSNSYFRHFANGSGFTPDHWQVCSLQKHLIISMQPYFYCCPLKLSLNLIQSPYVSVQ